MSVGSATAFLVLLGSSVFSIC